MPVLDPFNLVVPQTSSRRRRTLQSANQDTSGEILSSLTSSYEDEDEPEAPVETPKVDDATMDIPSSLRRVDDIRETEFDEKLAVISHQTSEFTNNVGTST